MPTCPTLTSVIDAADLNPQRVFLKIWKPLPPPSQCRPELLAALYVDEPLLNMLYHSDVDFKAAKKSGHNVSCYRCNEKSIKGLYYEDANECEDVFLCLSGGGGASCLPPRSNHHHRSPSHSRSKSRF